MVNICKDFEGRTLWSVSYDVMRPSAQTLLMWIVISFNKTEPKKNNNEARYHFTLILLFVVVRDRFFWMKKHRKKYWYVF